MPKKVWVKGTKVRPVSFYIEEELVHQLDEVAKDMDTDRSTLIRALVVSAVTRWGALKEVLKRAIRRDESLNGPEG